MKRTALARKTSLARTPFPQRHPAEVASVDFTRTAGLTRTPPKRRPKISDGTREQAFRRSGRKCVVCGNRTRLQAHHCLPVRGWPELANLAENMVGVCPGCHDAHERASRRIRWDELPQCVITLAYSTSGAAAMFLERTYPR